MAINVFFLKQCRTKTVAHLQKTQGSSQTHDPHANNNGIYVM
jgi:hypothetical protein